MRTIEISELMPPLVYRVKRYLKKRIALSQNQPLKTHPYDLLPNDLNVKWVLDVGANVGDVVLAALQTFPQANVICFEPVRSTFDILSKRLKHFEKRVHLHNLALSDLKQSCEINITNSHGANSISAQASFHQDINPHVREVSKEVIQLVRLDDFANQFPTQKIDIMKIDVEGHELNVLKGGAQFISNNVDIVIVEISLMRDPSMKEQAVFELFSFFKEIGFCLINVMDLHHVENKPMQLVQMDCVFRNLKMMA